MKIIITLFVIFFFGISYSQTKIIKKNITERNLKIERLYQNIDSLKIKIKDQNLINTNSFNEIDTLNKDLLFYKVKEDYYATVISEQSTRFAIIVSGILALFIFISFKSFKYGVSKNTENTKKKIQKIEEEFIEFKDELSETSDKLHGGRGNLYTSVSMYFESKKNYHHAFEYQILAAKSHGIHSENNSLKDKEYRVCIVNLNLSLGHLKKESINTEYLIKINGKTKETLDELNSLKSDKVKDLIAEIRILFNKKINVA
ncbi:MAG: hypothetical protein ACJA1D_001901, partial [Polaribacter sp.]|jgi:hypothetical protein